LQIVKIALGKFGSKIAKIQGSKCDNSHLGQLGLPRIISMIVLGLSKLGVLPAVKGSILGKNGSNNIIILFLFIPLWFAQ
jgi:hypothetical protein